MYKTARFVEWLAGTNRSQHVLTVEKYKISNAVEVNGNRGEARGIRWTHQSAGVIPPRTTTRCREEDGRESKTDDTRVCRHLLKNKVERYENVIFQVLKQIRVFRVAEEFAFFSNRPLTFYPANAMRWDDARDCKRGSTVCRFRLATIWKIRSVYFEKSPSRYLCVTTRTLISMQLYIFFIFYIFFQ